MAILGYLPKLKRHLRLAFGAHFLPDFSVKMFAGSYLLLILIKCWLNGHEQYF